MSGLYVHVPFCVKKCAYCDFYSLPLGAVMACSLEENPETYLEALYLELGRAPVPFSPATVYIGGGTPTSLTEDQLSRLLSMIHERVDIGHVSEWTCEANPGSIGHNKAQTLSMAGVNRISLGTQTFEDDLLDLLGRIHSGNDAMAAFHLLREHGFKNINIDLMCGIPGSTRDHLKRDLDTLLKLSPEHVACYCLSFEEGTPLTKRRNQGLVQEMDDEEEWMRYQLIRKTFIDAGYHHYEISNFAKPGYECRHNLLYWGGGEYIGCGPSAHSHWNEKRFGNVRNLAGYCTSVLKGKPARDFEERLEPAAKARETLVMGLRQLDGVAADAFREQTGFDYHDLCRDEIKSLCEEGLLVEEDGCLRLAERALFISDTVFSALV